jgi:hypothetical protein
VEHLVAGHPQRRDDGVEAATVGFADAELRRDHHHVDEVVEAGRRQLAPLAVDGPIGQHTQAVAGSQVA